MQSPFLEASNIPLRVKEGALSFIQVAKFPAARCGHLLVIPNNPVASPFDLSDAELTSILDDAKKSIRLLTSIGQPKPEGFTVVWNINRIAGQSVPHAHLHIIGRMKGDTIKDKSGNKIAAKGGIASVIESNDAFYAYPLHSVKKLDMASGERLIQNETSMVVTAPHSVAKDHALLVLKNNPPSFLDITPDQFIGMIRLAADYSQRAGLLDEGHGLNIGWDIGTAAGQLYEGSVAQIVPRHTNQRTVMPTGTEEGTIMTIAKLVRPIAPNHSMAAANPEVEAARLKKAISAMSVISSYDRTGVSFL